MIPVTGKRLRGMLHLWDAIVRVMGEGANFLYVESCEKSLKAGASGAARVPWRWEKGGQATFL